MHTQPCTCSCTHARALTHVQPVSHLHAAHTHCTHKCTCSCLGGLYFHTRGPESPCEAVPGERPACGWLWDTGPQGRGSRPAQNWGDEGRGCGQGGRCGSRPGLTHVHVPWDKSRPFGTSAPPPTRPGSQDRRGVGRAPARRGFARRSFHQGGASQT